MTSIIKHPFPKMFKNGLKALLIFTLKEQEFQLRLEKHRLILVEKGKKKEHIIRYDFQYNIINVDDHVIDNKFIVKLCKNIKYICERFNAKEASAYYVYEGSG
jgi:hypothetical protein